jgi:hypothetical protein
MELAHFNEQNYQLGLQAYLTAFPDFKYKPLNFVFVEIETSSRVLETPFMVQPITKPVSPLKHNTFTYSKFYYTYSNDHYCPPTCGR